MKRVFKLGWIFLIFILPLTGCSKEYNRSEVKALKENIIAIDTVEAGSDFKDLTPVKDILKDKKIVALGEATHGTSEFFKMKHRFFEFLVEELGYRVFAMECSGGGGQMVNDYIVNGNGSLDEALNATGFAVWKTDEVKDMIEWMKKYNDNPTHKQKIKFYGFDIQAINHVLPKLSYHLGKLDKELQTKVEEDLLHSLYRGNIINLNDEQTDDMLVNINEFKKAMENTTEKYLNNNLESEYELALWNLNLVTQYIEYNKESKKNNTGLEQSATVSNLRDKYMADNVKWIQDYESKLGNDKVMLWAHNLHVSYMDNNFKYMGKNLKEIYGDEYYSLGFEFSRGSFNARDDMSSIAYKQFEVNNAGSEYLAYKFDKAGVPIAFLDFNLASKNETISKMVSKEQGFTLISDFYNEAIPTKFQYIPKNLFDGLIYIRETTPSKMQ